MKHKVNPDKLRRIARKHKCTVEEVERRIQRLMKSSTITRSNAVKFLTSRPAQV
jgi:DNA-binding Lrp family transcriptional regulator